MNNGDRDAFAELKTAVKDMHKVLEKITTNDLPHITEKLDEVEEKVDTALGKLSVLNPLAIATLTIVIMAIVGFVVFIR